VIVYRFSWFTYLLARLVIGRRTMGLPNVVLGRGQFPELLQRDVAPEALVRAIRGLQAGRPQVEAAVAELRTKMGSPGASERAADLMLELLP
jgi:lipid-A-disaccharide synthase